jgi:hypothetical protein
MSRRKVQANYVNNKDFYESIKTYLISSKENPDTKIPNYIGICIMQICNRLSTKLNFSGYTYRDEMIADAVENCVQAIKGFNPDKSQNPFAYFTQIAWNAFLRRIAKEKKEVYTKHKNMQQYFLFETEIDNDVHIDTKSNKLSDQVIANFENKLTKTKKKSNIGLEKFIEDTNQND